MKALVIFCDYEDVGDVLLVHDDFDVCSDRKEFYKSLEKEGKITLDADGSVSTPFAMDAMLLHQDYLRSKFEKLEFEYA